MVERVRCFNEAETRILGYEEPLIAYKHAAALQIAVRVDKGEITGAEAEAETKMMMAQLQMQAAAPGLQTTCTRQSVFSSCW